MSYEGVPVTGENMASDRLLVCILVIMFLDFPLNIFIFSRTLWERFEKSWYVTQTRKALQCQKRKQATYIVKNTQRITNLYENKT